MRIYLLVLLLYSVSWQQLFGQGDFRSGYIIRMNGDSINGEVAYRHTQNSSLICKFRPGKSGKPLSYTADDLRAYGYYFDKRFESRQLPDSSVRSRVFAEIILKGHMSLFKVNRTLYVELPTGEIIELPRPSGKQERLDLKMNEPTPRFVSILNGLLADCALKADDLRYKSEEIDDIIRNYNRCHNQRSFAYKATKESAQFDYQIFAGFESSDLLVRGDAQKIAVANNAFAGISVDFSSPKLFDRIFISFEAIYSTRTFQFYQRFNDSAGFVNHQDYTVEQNMLKIPVSIRYNFFDAYRTVYVKGGGVYSHMFKSNIELLTERESSSHVYTSISTTVVKGSQAGLFGSIGYTQGINSKVKGFLEIRYEHLNLNRKYFGPGYFNTTFYVFTGIRF